jgi:hypothetical protein
MIIKFIFITLLYLASLLVCPIALAQMPTPQALLTELDINQRDITRLNAGEVVLFNVPNNSDTELTAGIIIYLSATPAHIIALIKKDGLASLDPLALSGGGIPLNTDSVSPNDFSFKPEKQKANDFLNATPGDKFNFSTEEYQLINSKNILQTPNASEMYRQLLWKRLQSYRQLGVKGIAPYDRGNNILVNPSKDLTIAAEAHDLASDYYPDIFKAWRDYPNYKLPNGVEESYTWSNRLVQGQPSAMLTHRFILSDKHGELMLGRQFYSEHSFNVNQLTITCLPYMQGALLFYTNRNFTDQVGGFGSGIKRLIGNNLAQEQVVTLLLSLQQHLKEHR